MTKIRMPGRKTDPVLIAGLIILALAMLLIPQPASADLTSSPDTYVTISCDVPGQIIEAGETAKFSLDVHNYGQENNKKMWFESFDAARYNWDVRFMDGDTDINMIALPKNGEKTVTLEIETNSDTPTGQYSVRLHIGDGWYWVYVTISKTHTGEKGTLLLSVVDKDGEKVKGAQVSVLAPGDRSVVDSVMSTADGKVSTDIVQGQYTLLVTKAGYKDIEKKDIRIKGGITTDAGTVMLEKEMYAAEITVQSPVIATSVGENPKYQVSVHNIGKSDDTYKLGVQGVPGGWYVRYRESGAGSADISEIFIKSGEEEELEVEAIPPYGIDVGDYNFSLVLDSSQESYTENLTAKIKGSYDLRVYAEQYSYPVNKGDALEFNLTLTNAGSAGALTNVMVTVTAPDGWNAEITPETIAGIPAGENAGVKVRIVPPGNIVASEYKITVKVSSDQTEKSDDFRVDVHEQSLVAVFGIGILVLIGCGVFYMFRKYNRR